MMVQYIPFLTSPTMELQLKPEITSMDPTESAITGGETAVIIGRQFLPGIQVYFGDTMADSVRFYTSTILKCKIPSGEEGYTDVIVINENGLADTLLNGFYYSPVISLENSESGLPKRSVLYANYPNPFNPITVISYSVGANNYSPVQIDLSIYNSLGQKVCTLVSEQQGAGNYSVEWNASGFSSGIYFYRIKAGSYEMVRKMLLVK
ncbi:MAG: T9SS type A sorting domain-containing protein [Calditrichaceae bacterium]